MANLETLVRPFQLPDTSVSQQFVTANQPSMPPIMLYFGRSGSGITLSESFSSQTTYYQDQQLIETSG